MKGHDPGWHGISALIQMALRVSTMSIGVLACSFSQLSY
jgi:hypothetical protein